MKHLLSLWLILSASSLFAWSPTGHMVIGDIAKERMTPKAQAKCTELLAVKVPPEKIKLGKNMVSVAPRTGSFVTACCWADDVKSAADAPWHYVDIAFSADGTPLPAPSPLLPASRSILTALTNAVAVLQSPKATKLAKAIQLRYLIHFVGDLHQPLHCATRCTDTQPSGDSGGNGFAVVGGPDLHAYWDGGCGLLKTTVARPLTNAALAKLAPMKAQCAAALPSPAPSPSPCSLLPAPPFAAWSQESFALAQSAAYAELEPHDTPGASYVSNAQRVVRERVALAGYRLAALLNEIFK